MFCVSHCRFAVIQQLFETAAVIITHWHPVLITEADESMLGAGDVEPQQSADAVRDMLVSEETRPVSRGLRRVVPQVQSK